MLAARGGRLSWTRNRPHGLVYRDPALHEAGYTLYAAVRGKHANLLDAEGRIVHRWPCDEGVTYAQLLDNGNLLLRTHPPEEAGGVEKIGGSSGALLELDWDGKVLWEHRNPMLHHDFLRLPSGNTLILTWRKLPPEISAAVPGGHHHEDDPELMWGDVVQEITPQGEVAHEWRSWEHLSLDEDSICPLESHKEWTHANSIAVTPDGDWLLSFRLTDTVAIVDRASGAFKWKWGKDVLSHQHHASWLDNGRVLVFDNGAHRRRGPNFSQVVEVDPATGEIEWTYKHPTIVGFYSFFVSSAERLPGGNTLINSGAHAHLFEVTPEGETVWEFVSPFFYESAFGETPAVFRAHRYPAHHPGLRGRELDPARHAELNARIASGSPVREGESEA
jgi:outer membrane protein assembly factor BamB